MPVEWNTNIGPVLARAKADDRSVLIDISGAPPAWVLQAWIPSPRAMKNFQTSYSAISFQYGYS